MSAFRILLVDDEPKNLILLEACLAPFGHQLIRASGGVEALRLFDEQPPDLVLLDYVMPEINGMEVLRKIRSQPQYNHIPVVLVTALSDREHRLEGLDAGADEFLEKPVDRALLLLRVKTLLKLKASHDALAASNVELALRHQALQQAQAEQKELTAFIVHDLKNPLSVVCAGLDYVQRRLPALDANVAEAITEAREGGQRLSIMIADLLTIARMESAEFTLHREAFLVDRLLRSVTESYLRRAEEHEIVLAPPTDVSMEISADRTLLRRVLENIIDNAFRYTPARGRIAIEARTGSGIEILVSNDGPVIPAGDRARIFQKFKRGDVENASRSNAGLGLYFCKRAVEAHGGAIDIVDDRDFATSFRITLPAEVATSARTGN